MCSSDLEQQPAAAAPAAVVPEAAGILRIAAAVPQAAVPRVEEVLREAAATVHLPMIHLQGMLLWTGLTPSSDFRISGARPGRTALTAQDW